MLYVRLYSANSFLSTSTIFGLRVQTQHTADYQAAQAHASILITKQGNMQPSQTALATPQGALLQQLAKLQPKLVRLKTGL
jgi:hypothetical protein